MAIPVPSARAIPNLKVKLRMFLRDVPGRIPGSASENILLDNVEFSDDELDAAVELTLDRYNTSPPPLAHITVDRLPISILLLGVSAYLMRSESFRQLRNQAADPEVGGTIDDKHPLYDRLGSSLMQEFEEKLRSYKVGLNIAAGWGDINSGYGRYPVSYRR